MYDFKIAKAARVVGAGGIVAYATEGVFGLGVDPFQPDAVARLRDLKGRRAAQRFIVIASGLAAIAPYVRIPAGALGAEVLASWPGPVTWVLPCLDRVPRWLRSPVGTLAVRVTNHPQAAALCDRAGPIISTSANPTGRAPARDAAAVRRYFGASIDYLLPGRVGGIGGPTRIRDGRTGREIRVGSGSR